MKDHCDSFLDLKLFLIEYPDIDKLRISSEL